MIRIEGLVKHFGATQVLRGIGLDVSRGEVCVLIGASGCGKSTLLRCINGLETFDAGRVEVSGHALDADLPPPTRTATLLKLRRCVGMVFQQFNLFPHMSVLENVMCGPLYALGVARAAAGERAKRLLDRVGMGHKADSRPGNLSGGQQQRVAIARALANEPDVILFDEPTSALDPRMTAEVLAVMADLATAGQTMLVVSHAMGFVRRSAHRVHVLADGQVIESGPPQQIFESPRHKQTKEFLAESAMT